MGFSVVLIWQPPPSWILKKNIGFNSDTFIKMTYCIYVPQHCWNIQFYLFATWQRCIITKLRKYITILNTTVSAVRRTLHYTIISASMRLSVVGENSSVNINSI